MDLVKMSADEVKAIAKLVKLVLTESEIEEFRKTIPQTLGVIDVLKELNTKNVLPTSSVTGLNNVFKDDAVSTTLSQTLVLTNAHEVSSKLFVTKAVFDRL